MASTRAHCRRGAQQGVARTGIVRLLHTEPCPRRDKMYVTQRLLWAEQAGSIELRRHSFSNSEFAGLQWPPPNWLYSTVHILLKLPVFFSSIRSHGCNNPSILYKFLCDRLQNLNVWYCNVAVKLIKSEKQGRKAHEKHEFPRWQSEL